MDNEARNTSDSQTTQNQTSQEGQSILQPTVAGKPQSKDSKKTFAVVLMAVSLILIIGGFLYFLGQRKSKEEAEESPFPEETIEEVATETPTPVVFSTPTASERGEVKIQILNGTGIAKEGSFLEEALKKLGYKVFTVGNSETQDFTDTEVTYSSTLKESVKSEIVAELNKLYKNVKTAKSSTLSYDIKIITGLRKGSTPKPSIAATSTAKASSTPTGTAKATSTASASPTSSPTPTPAP